MRKLAQDLALAAARLALSRGLLATPAGRRFYAGAYDLYKRLIEAPAIEHLQAEIRPGGWAIDVGANIGFFTTRFARWVSAGGRVLAIEPEPNNLAMLRAALARAGVDSLVDVIAAAAAESDGTLHLHVQATNPADHRLADHGLAVAAVSLDGLLERRGWPAVSLVKVDVQGAEQRVLAGAEHLFERQRPSLLIELFEPIPAAPTGLPRALFAALTERGYRAHGLRRAGITPPLDLANIERLVAARGYVDVLFRAQRR